MLLLGCPPGKYGLNCQQNCTCQNNAKCDSVTGACWCGKGHYGTLCEHGKTQQRGGLSRNKFQTRFKPRWKERLPGGPLAAQVNGRGECGPENTRREAQGRRPAPVWVDFALPCLEEWSGPWDMPMCMHKTRHALWPPHPTSQTSGGPSARLMAVVG